MRTKRSFVELEEAICVALRSYPKTVWELVMVLDSKEEVVKRRLQRLQERGAIIQYNKSKLWHWLPPEKREIPND